jgi:hypothetical protein
LDGGIRVIVLRDTPRALPDDATLVCVEEAIAEDRRADDACSIPRRTALHRDAAVVAAERLGADVVDLTRLFCDSGRHGRCLPVIGGVLVHNDPSHLTQVFARTLGPYVDRALRRSEARGHGAAGGSATHPGVRG